jgi:DNA topoisomerase-3
MNEIAEMTRHIVERAKGYGTTDVPGDYATLASPCPRCGAVVKENYRRFACTGCEWSITKSPSSRLLEPAEAESLIQERTIGPLHGFRSKMGRPFSAILKLEAPDWNLKFDFGQSDADAQNEEPVDFSAHQALGACPKCGARIFDHGMNYVCEKSVGVERSCDFRSGKVILQQQIEPAQMVKLLAEGRTDLLAGFVSKKNNRRFKAMLVREPSGKIGFEFQQGPGPKAGARTAKSEPSSEGAAEAGVPDTGSATPARTARATKAPAKTTRSAATPGGKTTTAAKAPARKRAAPARKAAGTASAAAAKRKAPGKAG